MKVVLHPDAEQDLQDAAAFYEREGSPALAAKFVAEFKLLTTLLIAHPDIGKPRANDRLGFPMKLFPYTVIYRANPNEIRILVIKHDSRRPGYGAKRV